MVSSICPTRHREREALLGRGAGDMLKAQVCGAVSQANSQVVINNQTFGRQRNRQRNVERDWDLIGSAGPVG